MKLRLGAAGPPNCMCILGLSATAALNIVRLGQSISVKQIYLDPPLALLVFCGAGASGGIGKPGHCST